MAPLIRFTLVALYLALVLPLPLLAPPELRPLLLLALVVGLLAVLAMTSEGVQLDQHGIVVGHPAWCAWLLRRGWSLAWSEVVGLTPVATSQAGRVYYVRSRPAASPDPGAPNAAAGKAASASPGEAASQTMAGPAYLLPQRVADFDDFLARFSQSSGLDTSTIGRISPPWTYQLLALLSALMLAGEGLGLALRLRN